MVQDQTLFHWFQNYNVYKGGLIFNFLALQFFVFILANFPTLLGALTEGLSCKVLAKLIFQILFLVAVSLVAINCDLFETEEDEEVSIKDTGRFKLGFFRSDSFSVTHFCQRVWGYVCLYVLILLISLPSPPQRKDAKRQISWSSN